MKLGSWTASVVSHGHGRALLPVLQDLYQQLSDRPYRLILTLNIPEDEGFLDELPQTLRAHLEVRRNSAIQGFAANHNAALTGADSEFVLVADPCLRLPTPILDGLQERLQRPEVGIVSPQALDPDGQLEDNGRDLVSPASLFGHYVLGQDRRPAPQDLADREVEWLAGLFLALRRETFEALGGFDSRYFLYCEDVDLSLRARQRQLQVRLMPSLQITHAANRDTRRKWRHFLWHVRSLLRLWRSAPYRWALRHRLPAQRT